MSVSPPAVSKKPDFDWQRFWVPRTGTVDLSDGGFLVDPIDAVFHYGTSRPLPLNELTDHRALVLLGEPGIGKSTTLLREAQRTAHQAAAGDTISIHINLRAYSSEVLLHKRLFESTEFLAWLHSTSQLVLYLDSLDEALLRIDNIAALLADELPRYPASRMSLRIACRTAVWPTETLDPALTQLWGDSSVGVFELAPLRRRDVVTSAIAQDLDHEAFMRELYAANAVPFAIKPLTLNLLFGLFKNEGRLPRKIADLYARGCLKLCEESNQSRRDSRRVGALSGEQRLRVASRIAATTMFANRYSVWTGLEADGVPEEDVPVSALTGEAERGTFSHFEVTEECVREVLDTGLFTSRGSSRLGWAHQSYAEFLAALYLTNRQVTPKNILRLVQHPAGGLVPQLSVVTAWIASINRDVRQALIESDPIVLLQGDLTNWTEDDLASLTGSLLTALNHTRVHDFVLGIYESYARLNHPTLASQLRPFINDPAKNIAARRTAIAIAERCKLCALQRDLLDLALDASDDAHLRGRAVAALSTCGDETVPIQLLPLARGEIGPDPQDDIKGHALEILWPNHLSVDDLFGLITCPNQGYVGAYVMFLTRTLPRSLKVNDLPAALAWTRSLISDGGHNADFHRRSLADSIFTLAWKHLGSPRIVEPLVDYVVACLSRGDELFQGTSLHESEAFLSDLKLDIPRRTQFLHAAAKRPTTRLDAFHLYRAGFLCRDDLPWLLSICPGGGVFDPTLDATTLINMISAICDINDYDHFDRIYDSALRWPVLWNQFRFNFEGVQINSLDALQFREYHRAMKELERRKPPPLTPPPAERIETLLSQF
jgi:hypothetical protein